MNEKTEKTESDCCNKVVSNQLVIMHPLTFRMYKPGKHHPPLRLRIVQPASEDDQQLQHAKALARYRLKRGK